MSVLHVHAGNLFGGIERVLLTLRNASTALTHHTALCYDARLLEELPPDEVTLLGGARLSMPWTWAAPRRRLRDVLRAVRPDVVMYHAPWAQRLFGSTVAADQVATARWYHGAPSAGDRLERRAARVAITIGIYNSEFTRRAAAPFRGDGPAVVVHPPVPRMARNPANRARVRQQFGSDAGTTVMLAVSRIEPGKGHAVLLEALAGLEPDGNWRCWIVGGAQRAREVRSLRALRHEVRRRGLEHHVWFLGERPDVEALYGAADIFCQANTEPDAFGVSYVEALSAGLPVVTSAIGGALEIVTPECGALVPPGDAEALRTAIGALVADPAARSRLAAAGPARAQELSDPERQAARLAAALREALPP